MHVTGDLGFSSLVLAVFCLVVPAIALSIRRKWRLAAARKEEIRRLLVLASEESARAELEAAVSYAAVSSSYSVPSNAYQCAVCFSPTTKLCARCKNVRYCSGKCQIVHWRQGHKEECRTNSNSYLNKEDGSNFVPNMSKKERHGIYDENYGKSSIATSTKSPSSDSSGISKVTHEENDNVKVDSSADTGGTSPISESSGASFSGFSSSPGSSESSDNVSVVESISSNEVDRCDGQESADAGPRILESNLDKVVQTKPLSPKFASLIDSADSFSKLSKLKQSKPSNLENKIVFETVGSAAQRFNSASVSSVTDPGKVSSGFWERTIDSVAIDDVQDDSAPCNPIESDNSKLYAPESFLNFKFNLSGSDTPYPHRKSSERISGAQGIGNPVDGGVVSEDISVNAPKARPFPSSIWERPTHADNDAIDSKVSISVNAPKARPFPSSTWERPTHADNDATDSKVSMSSEFKSASSSSADKALLRTDAPKVCRSPSVISKSSDPVIDETFSNSHLSESKISPPASQTSLACHPSVHSVPSGKFGKVNNFETGSLHSSQMTSSSSSISGLKSSVWKVVDQFKGPKSGRCNDKGLFSYDLFVKLYTSSKVEMRPFGLINCGNSCYANSVLQCLAFTPPLTAYFVQGLHSKSCVNKEWCFTCEFEKLILKAKEGKSPLSPAGILSQLQSIGSQLGNGREEDAHEFLRYAIDTMQSVCLKEAGGNTSGFSEEETTLIGLTFGGYLRSKIKCMKCQLKSERQERMMDLTVEIEGDIDKLEDALKRFTGTEILDGDNKYQCSRCKSYEKAKKKLTILEAPNVLTIALKRFQSGKFGKLNKSICFPEILDLAPYMSGTSDKSPIYRLYGVVVHLDIMNAAFSGHYVCYVKNIQNKWFKIDDSSVTAVAIERVLAKGAYILLYARCSPRAPRLLRNNPSKISAKNTVFSSRSTSMRSNVFHLQPNSIPPDNTASVESFYLKFHRLQKILEEDSSSDNFSFTSSNSDEGSCSTDSTRDSTSTDDLSDYIFGGWNSPWKSMSDSDTSSSSSSPLYASHSSQTSRYKADVAKPEMEDDLWDGLTGRGSHRLASSEGKGGETLLPSDRSKQWSKLDSRSCRETDSVKLGSVNPFDDVKRRVSFRRLMSERTG